MPGDGKDLQGRRYLTFKQAKPGTLVQVDGDFTCIRKGARRTIKQDTTVPKWQRLWIHCDCGRHYLDGQADFDKGQFYVGIYSVSK